MSVVDGNAIAGTLYNVFGSEMTTMSGVCANCGMTSRLAEMKVYPDAPGVIGRCPGCGNLLLAIVDRRGVCCVDLTGFRSLESDVQLSA